MTQDLTAVKHEVNRVESSVVVQELEFAVKLYTVFYETSVTLNIGFLMDLLYL